jgi:hypothetical protein
MVARKLPLTSENVQLEEIEVAGELRYRFTDPVVRERFEDALMAQDATEEIIDAMMKAISRANREAEAAWKIVYELLPQAKSIHYEWVGHTFLVGEKKESPTEEGDRGLTPDSSAS